MSGVMVERVARALCALENPEGSPDDMFGAKPRWVHYFPAAMTAIEAMREPSPAMIDAGVAYALNVAIGDSWSAYVAGKHRSMIDAALAEGGMPV